MTQELSTEETPPYLHPLEHVGSHVLRTSGQDQRRVSRVHPGVLDVHVRCCRHHLSVKTHAVHLDLTSAMDELQKQNKKNNNQEKKR